MHVCFDSKETGEAKYQKDLKKENSNKLKKKVNFINEERIVDIPQVCKNLFLYYFEFMFD